MQTVKFTTFGIQCLNSQKSNAKNLIRAHFSDKPPRKPASEFIVPSKLRKRIRKVFEGPPQPPTKCCQKGCDNCVWIGYAEELILYYKDGGAAAAKAIDAIEDESLKAFIKMEMKNKFG